jgi:hypothetical protein
MQGCFGGRAPHSHQRGSRPHFLSCLVRPVLLQRAFGLQLGPSRRKARSVWAYRLDSAARVVFIRYVTYNEAEPSEWLRQGCGKALLRVHQAAGPFPRHHRAWRPLCYPQQTLRPACRPW